MPRSPVRVYGELIRRARTALGVPDEVVARRRLYTVLKPDRLVQHPEVQEILRDLGIGASYARNHLLSLGGWPDDVVALVRDGLPLGVARRLAHLTPRDRRTAHHEAATIAAGTFGQRMHRAIDRVVRDAEAPRASLVEGWLPPAAEPESTPGPSADVWRFPVLGPSGREAEELHPDLANAILARYAGPGDRVVDLTAGAGTVGRAARRRGNPSWSGDIAPRAPFVHTVDATDLVFDDGLTPHVADVVVLHPPTYFAWRRTRPAGTVEGREGYSELIGDLAAGGAQVVRPGGFLITIGRPVRVAGSVYTAIGELERVLEEVGAPLVGYHLGVDHRGTEDWHVLVGRWEAASDDG